LLITVRKRLVVVIFRKVTIKCCALKREGNESGQGGERVLDVQIKHKLMSEGHKDEGTDGTDAGY
jgi:hypothetical protein